METKIKILGVSNVEELEGLLTVFERTFDMEHFKRPRKEYLRTLLSREDFFVVIVKFGNQIIAGLTAYLLEQYYVEKPLAYIYDVAVLKEYQRKGVGKQLITFVNRYFYQRGVEGVFVQANKSDDDALKFYRSTEPDQEEPVFHFYYALNK